MLDHLFQSGFLKFLAHFSPLFDFSTGSRFSAFRLVTIENPSLNRTAQEFIVPRASTVQACPLRP
jgi:hypothetical protein